MDFRQIKEHLGRVKPYYLRNETLRALAAAITALKGLPAGTLPSPIRSEIRIAVQYLNRDPAILEKSPGGLAYQPGEERNLLRQLALIYKNLLEDVDRESHEEAMARKIKLDHAYNQGVRLLVAGKISEADQSFTEALEHYKDEHRILLMIGKTLYEAHEIRRALPYLKRGMETAPNDTMICELYAAVLQQRHAAEHAATEDIATISETGSKASLKL